ncbi:amiloride-sensitive sodium channel subunit alpha-like [Tropilaelaps mercedesae]|uniref:Amiloride-sensitive sodium channel subunit alpha-like n=1 Tax=Tropilaelaps mercedesae TaxID=418985 RepID=A0A1V9X0I3_9ACAR|nr:amiloride-sensitive sodium channel subunit alpha-like [Tropilaelaps mercedesae]
MAPRWLSDQVTALRLSFMDSSLPGLKVICGFGNPMRRTAWLIVFLALFGLTINDIVNLAIEYYKYPDSLNIKYEEPEGGRKMPMPAVTVCNLNPYKWTRFCENIDKLLNVSESLVSTNTTKNMQKMKLLYCNEATMKAEERTPVWNLTKEYMELMQHFTDWSGVLQRNLETKELMENISHTHNDMVELATFDNDFLLPCNNNDIDLANITDDIQRSVCQHNRKKSPKPDAKMYPRYGTCQCYFCKHTKNHDDVTRMESFDGPQNGLMLVLKVEDMSYLPFIVEAGFLIAIHDQGVEVDFTKDGVFIQPLTTTFIGVGRRALRRLPEPYKNPCRHDWPPFLKNKVEAENKYTAFECRDMCHQYMIFHRLKCTSLKYPMMRIENKSAPHGYSDLRLRACGPDQETEIRKIEQMIRKKTIDCQCNNVCDEIGFDKTTSSLLWHPKIQLDTLSNPNESSMAQVYVYMKSNLINNRTKVGKMNSREFVSGIGSIMGMYLGYSFLFCWSILDVLGRAAVNTYHAYRRDKATRQRDGKAQTFLGQQHRIGENRVRPR